MSADIIQIRDHQSRRQREQAEAALREMTLEQQAIEVMNVALMGAPGMSNETIPYGGQGIDGMFTDTAPSEYCAPDKDSA